MTPLDISAEQYEALASTIDFAARMFGSFVIPLGSKRMCANFGSYTSSGTPYSDL